MTLRKVPSEVGVAANTILRILGAELTFVLGTGVVFGLLLALRLGDAVLHDPLTRMWADLLLAAVLSGSFVLYGQKLGGVPARAFSFAFGPKDAVFALLAGILTLGLAAGYMLLISRSGAHPITAVAPSLGLLLIGFLGEFGVLHEEVLNRGYILPLLRSRYGTAWALLVSAVLFSLSHAIFKRVDFMLVSHFLVGIALGYMYLKSGSLTLTTTVHAFHNFAADLFLQGNNNGVSLGIGVFQFSAHLGALERLAFDLLLALATLGLTYWAYGRGTRFSEASARLPSVGTAR
ncbi:MAG: hypothetical protein C4332_02635 [Meiothermus sp.]